jgi:hypothetical protein
MAVKLDERKPTAAAAQVKSKPHPQLTSGGDVNRRCTSQSLGQNAAPKFGERFSQLKPRFDVGIYRQRQGTGVDLLTNEKWNDGAHWSEC